MYQVLRDYQVPGTWKAPKIESLLFQKSFKSVTMAPSSSIESYCTFTLASDVTAGGLPSEEEIAKDLESSDDEVSVD